MTPELYAQLLRPINPKRVGKDGKGFSHLEAYDVRAHLIRLFGFGGFSQTVDVMELVFETCEERKKDNRTWTAWTVSYRARCTLTVPALGCVFTEWAEGGAQNYPARGDAHDQAMKTAESQAFKRCAVNLGDQFGLSLYAKGSLKAVVVRTLNPPSVEAQDDGEREDGPVDAHVEEVPPENAPADDPREHTSRPEPAQPAADEHTAAQAVAAEAVTADKRTLAKLTITHRALWPVMVEAPNGKPLRLKALLDQLARAGESDVA